MNATTHAIDLTQIHREPHRTIDIATDHQPAGGPRIGFTDYYMTLDGKPFYGVAGELHFSRMSRTRWNDELAKMRMAGVNIVSTYVFWNHHEEHEGSWDFSGSKNLREFIELCARNGLYVILRPGPFNHGECRNGGLPDWLYGKPYRVRSCDQGFLDEVRVYFSKIGEQIKGLLYRDGGPIIASQLDNEYMHSSAPWEMTTGVSNEWVYCSREGNDYMHALRRIAEETGITVPFYTCTGWGGAPVPDDLLPLWGDYAYWPWIFYQRGGEHPLTGGYVYRDYRSTDKTLTGDFNPPYDPTTRPYACAEMGGGMMVSYNYRFILPYKSVDAMTNVKMASGCNFLGYYVFHGGTNPTGDGIYLNESQVPKISYDYQAAIGEFGQLRESYRRVKSLHYFANAFGERLCTFDTVTPRESAAIEPSDLTSLRYSLRTDGHRGFLFLNNFQDHAHTFDQRDQNVTIRLADGSDVRFDHVGLAADENCVLPFNMDLDGITLLQATAQPVTRLRLKGADRDTFVFLAPRGMGGAMFVFGDDAMVDGMDGSVIDVHASDEAGRIVVEVPESTDFVRFGVSSHDSHIEVVCLDRQSADRMFVVRDEALAFSDDALFERGGALQVESARDSASLDVYPRGYCSSPVTVRSRSRMGGGCLDHLEFSFGGTTASPQVTRLAEDRFRIELPDGFLDMPYAKDALLRIRYHGDIGWLFLGSRLLSDNFCNGDVWEIGLRDVAEDVASQGLTLVITPLKKGVNVNVDSPMAARMENVEETLCELIDVSLVPVREICVDSR